MGDQENNTGASMSRSSPGRREPVPHELIQETTSEFPSDRSRLPQTVPHFVGRERECQSILRCLDPTHECRCILLHGPPGIGKTDLAIKAANDRRETDKNTMVVYVNCKFIKSGDDFAEKVLVQIYHYPLNNPISGLKTRLENSDFNKYTIMLLDNFEFLLHADDWIENQQIEEPVDRIKAITDFVASLFSSRNVKLLVTSSENVEFPSLGGEKITLGAFKPEQTFQLLKTVWKNRPVDKKWADQLSDFCSGIPLVLYTLISSQNDLESCLLQMAISPRDEIFEHLKKIKVVPEGEKINVCLDVCFGRLSPQKQNTLVCLSLLKGWFTPSGAAKVFQSTHSSERQLIGEVLELANCSLLVQNTTDEGVGWNTFLSLIREYCKRKEEEERFVRVFHSARNQCIDYFLNFLKDTYKMFLSRNALQAITNFQQEEENIMQLLEWLDKDQMDEERIMACIDVFNMVGELLAKMMSKRKFKSKYDLLKKKCQDKGDQQRLSECLTSLGIKEVFNCSCTPGLCDEASKRAKAYLEKAERIQNDLKITSGNSRAQCLAKLGRCLAKQRDPQGKLKIEEAIRIRSNDHSDEDICRVMLGATYNDMAVALSLEEDHRQAIKIRKEKTLPIYKEKLGEHPFTATIYNNISNNFCALGEFDRAKPYSEYALKVRHKLLNDHMDTAKSLFDLGMVHKEKGDFQLAFTYLKRSRNMQERVLEDSLEDLQRTEKELEEVIQRLQDLGIQHVACQTLSSEGEDTKDEDVKGEIPAGAATPGSLLSYVLTTKPHLIEQMALSLDREMRLIPNWRHFFNELKVDVNVIKRLEQYADFSPTIRLFEFLEVTQPNLTIQQLKQAFLEIRRNDLFTLLTTTAALSDSELVSEAITSQHPVAPSPIANVSLLDEIALKLDERSMNLANWSSLAVKLEVPRGTLKKFERRSTQSPTNKLFEYLGSTRPHMTVKTLKEALTKMERKDLLAILHEKIPQGEIFVKDVMLPGSELLLMVADKLDTEKVPWEKNWLQLAFCLQIPSHVYQGFETREQRKSPTMEVIRWLEANSPDITLIDIAKALDKIQRNDVIQIITKHFPDTVNSFLEQRSSPLSYEMSFDQPSATLKRDDCKQPGHCGSLPDPPYVLKGREVNCEEIIKSLLSNKAVEVVAPPGYGKTSVVVETAHRLIKYHGKYVAYVNPRGVTCVEDLGVTIIEALGEVPGDNTIRETLHRIRSLSAKNVVLMIENLDNLLHLEDNQERESDPHSVEYCPKMRGKNKKEDFLNFISEIGQIKKICLVLTSTEINDFSVCFPIDIIQLQPISETESSQLFKERDMSLDEDTIKKLVNICGGIPLIICTVLSILRTRNAHNLTRRLSNCTPLELLQELSPDYLQPENRIDLCLKVSFHHLSEENQEVLTKFSTFPHRFTQEQFYAVFSQPKTDRKKLEMCLNSLKHTSLLRFEKESCYFCIHPFIRKFCSVHNQSTHKQAKLTFIRHYSDVVIALSKKFLSRESKCAIDEYRSERENIKEATAWCEVEHHDLPSEATDYCIDAFIKAAVFLAKVMRRQEFESLFCKLSQNYRHDSKRHSACLTAVGTKIVLSCTCTPHICCRAWYRAKLVLSRANEIQLVETVDDATRAQCLSKLGFILVREGLFTEGFGYLDQALALRNKRWEQSKEDMDKVMIGACRNDIAASLMIQRKHLAAIETRRNDVLPSYESILGKDHAFVATTLSWIGRSYHELGEYDNAIKYATLALNIRQTLLGRHQETARSHYDLGVALSAKKNSERALKHLQHAIELQEEVLDTHEELVLSHQETAVVLKDLGNEEKAEREMERAGECAKRLEILEVPLQR